MTGAWARTPLRVKLVAVVVLLAGLGLAVVGTTATTSLRGYLVGRVDDQLRSIPALPRGGDGGPTDHGKFSTFYVGRIQPDGSVVTWEQPYGFYAPKAPSSIPADPITVPSTHSGEDEWRVIARQSDFDGTLYLIGINLRDVHSTTRQLFHLELLIGGIVLVVLAGVGYVVVRQSLRPLVAVESAAEAIAEGDLTQRVPESDPRTEVGSLSASFNTMVSRLESAFTEQAASEADARASEDRMRRFVGDASHELRTPLTSIRGFAELYRSGALPPGPDVDRAMSRIEGAAGGGGVRAGPRPPPPRPPPPRPLEHVQVDLLELASDAVADAAAVDPSRSVTLEAVASGPPPIVAGDAGRLRQVFGNLVTNALTHTPDGTPVAVRVSTDALHAVVEVADSGPGIAAEDRPRVFERFFRTDSSRTRASGGTGLGLSIVHALVAAHRGTVSVDETPGGGATFRVSLPLA